jgi:signal transduction histidine kinase
VGLGLAIVREIAKLHGGLAGAKNLRDGVCFYIFLPLEQSPTTGAQPFSL